MPLLSLPLPHTIPSLQGHLMAVARVQELPALESQHPVQSYLRGLAGVLSC